MVAESSCSREKCRPSLMGIIAISSLERMLLSGSPPSSCPPAAELQPLYIFNLFLPKQVPPVNADLSPAAQLSTSQGISAFLCRSANTVLGSPMPSQRACGHRPSSVLRHCPGERRGRFQLLSAPSCHLDFFHHIFFNKMGHGPK